MRIVYEPSDLRTTQNSSFQFFWTNSRQFLSCVCKASTVRVKSFQNYYFFSNRVFTNDTTFSNSPIFSRKPLFSRPVSLFWLRCLIGTKTRILRATVLSIEEKIKLLLARRLRCLAFPTTACSYRVVASGKLKDVSIPLRPGRSRRRRRGNDNPESSAVPTSKPDARPRVRRVSTAIKTDRKR